jgi:hypothetical protein
MLHGKQIVRKSPMRETIDKQQRALYRRAESVSKILKVQNRAVAVWRVVTYSTLSQGGSLF